MSKNALDRFIQSATYEPERRFIPSSLVSVNRVIGNNKGFQCGKMLELVGTISTGKSTLAYDLIKNAQAMDLRCAYINVERFFDQKYAQICGVDIQKLDLINADTAENNLSVVEMLARRGYGIIVIDSIPALIPKAHVSESPEDEDVEPDYEKTKKMAALGTLLGDWSKRMVPIIDYHNTLIVCINQFRANISTISHVDKKPYGPFAYNHNLTWRLELQRVKNEDTKTVVQVKVTKNRLGIERRIGQYEIIYGKGLDIKDDILQNAIRCGIVIQKGAWYYWNDTRAQGSEKAKELFDFELLREEILAYDVE